MAWNRHPRTHREAAETALHVLEGVHVRPSRRPENLPNSWDDRTPSNYRIRSWKYYRRAQFAAGTRERLFFKEEED